MRIGIITFVALICVAMVSCKKGSTKDISTLEIYTVQTDGENFAPDTLAYYETTHKTDNMIQKIEYYYSNGNLKGIEKYHYKDSDTLPYESKYYGPDDKQLSYYLLSYDKKGNKVMSAAYDASNDELLRRETFDYDNGGNITAKRIKNANDETQRIYTFTRDAKGNELTMNVENIDGSLVAAERYQITKIDGNGQWIEKYGIVNDVPKTFHVKK